MGIKEELKDEVKEEGGGKDELEALDALEKEAAEYNKVFSKYHVFMTSPSYSCLGCRDRSYTQSL